jgi:arylsulfatase A-like enzyme
MAGRRRAGGILLLLALLAASCRGSASQRPVLILILVDTLRADHLHAYGYPRETSPFLDALAGRGVLFEQAVSAAPWTLPAAMSLMTGRLPSSHRVENDGMKLAASIPLLAETLRNAGYATSAVVSHLYVSRPFGFDRGFDRFDDFGLSKDYRFEAGLEPRAEKVTDRALDQVRSLKSRPFFLFVHYFDPHWDYDPPPPFSNRFMTPYSGSITGKYSSFSEFARPDRSLSQEDVQHLVDLYDGEIAYTDSQIGRFLKGLETEGVARRSVVVVVADHGEEFKEHHSLGHGRNLYDESIRIPLLLADLRTEAPARRIAEQVRSIDLFPTLCDLAGIPAPRGIEGESLLPLTRAQAAPSRPAVSETIRFDAYRKAYRLPTEKLIVSLENNARELYDLKTDPGEQSNLYETRAKQAMALEHSLFEQVDVLAGGWNLRWSSDGKPHRFSGSVETDGLFTRVVPLFPESGRHRVMRGRRIDFDLEGVVRGGGLSFSVDPPEARIGFALALDGTEDSAPVFVGRERKRPSSHPFAFAGPLASDILSRPDFRSGEELGFFLWKNPGPSPEDATELSDAMKERLRSLGYLR